MPRLDQRSPLVRSQQQAVLALCDDGEIFLDMIDEVCCTMVDSACDAPAALRFI